MALTNSYLVTTKNVDSFFNALTTAQAPDAFTQKFLESLEFKSSNDRLFIGILKALGMIDEASSAPTERYYKFLDQTESKKVLAEGIKEAYSDLFAVNIKANELTVSDVKNKLRTLTQGKPSDNVLGWMANTFVALCGYADFAVNPKTKENLKQDKVVKVEDVKEKTDINPETPTGEEETRLINSELHYNIQIHLPESRDPAVYNAIFRSLKEHLV